MCRYDDVRQRVRGTALILQIAQKPANLEDLAFNETVMGIAIVVVDMIV